MRTRQLDLIAYLRAEPFRFRFRKQVVATSGHHLTLASVAISTFPGLTYHEAARLGRGDVGRYDFFAGSRIAFSRLLSLLSRHRAAHGWTPEDLKLLRRQIQLALSRAENEERQRELHALRASLGAEWRNLNALRFAAVLAGKRKPQAAEGSLVKPRAYRSVNDGQALPGRLSTEFIEVLRALVASATVIR